MAIISLSRCARSLPRIHLTLGHKSEYWSGVSPIAREFVRACLTVDPTNRPTAGQVLDHKWLKQDEHAFVADASRPDGKAVDLLPNVKAAFDGKKTCQYLPLVFLYLSRHVASPKGRTRHDGSAPV